MCVIAIFPKGVATPDIEVLKAMHRANPHGCGLCTPTMSYKGLDFKHFLYAVRLREDNEPMMLHFRYATHGSVKKTNCHPFYDKKTDTFFMHNGILNIKPKGDMTDSETAFRTLLVPKIEEYGLASKELEDEAAGILGWSKFAFMQGDRIRLMGDYYEIKGAYFSNLRFANL